MPHPKNLVRSGAALFVFEAAAYASGGPCILYIRLIVAAYF